MPALFATFAMQLYWAIVTHVDDDALTILPGSHVAAGLAQFFRNLQFVH